MRNTANGFGRASGWSVVITLAAIGASEYAVGADEERQLVVRAGPKDRAMVPMSIEAPAGLDRVRMTDAETGAQVPCQLTEGRLWWILDSLPAGKEKVYRVTPGEPSKPVVEVAKSGEHAFEVKIADKAFTTFVCNPKEIRPYCYPLFGPGQVRMTRGYPMVKDIAGEVKDHWHHRSLWVAYGELNREKFNFWHEPGDERKGIPSPEKWDKQIVTKIVRAEGGPVFGQIDAAIDWTAHTGKKVLEEGRQMRFYAIDGPARMLDLVVTFKATDGDVQFLDTKEGGICSLRVAEEIRELGKCGGRVTNSEGQVGGRPDGAWGKRAKWVDYSRTKDAQYGIAVFDTPGNLRYPTWWHVRDYGLFCANPFGIANFDPKGGQRGDYTLENGKELVFRYRLYLHQGDVEKAQVTARYEDYVNPPSAAWK